MAKIDIRKTNITIVGNWNVAILNPDWIQAQFPKFKTSDRPQLEIGLNIRDIRYELKEIIINPRPDRLIITPKIVSNDCFGDLMDLTAGILEKLSHTPIVAVGSNFAFSLDESEDISHMCGDREELHSSYKKIGKKYSGSSVIQHILTESDMQITVSYHISANTKMVTFNYNRDSEIKEEVKSFINDFKKHYEDTQNIINNLLGK